MAMPRRRRSATESDSASGMRRMCLSNPSAAWAPAALRICSANTGPYSIQWPSPSMIGWLSRDRTFSGWYSLWALMLSPPRSDPVFCGHSQPSVMMIQHGCTARRSERRVGGEGGSTLFEVRGEPFLDLGAAETEHLQRQRGVEGRSHRAQPVVQRVFRPTDGTLRAVGQSAGDFDRLCVEIGIVDRERDQPDALGLRA